MEGGWQLAQLGEELKETKTKDEFFQGMCSLDRDLVSLGTGLLRHLWLEEGTKEKVGDFQATIDHGRLLVSFY